VHPTPIEEWHSSDRESLLAEIKVCLGGYCGEKVKYGTTTSGVSMDFKQAMRISHAMVWMLGMGPSGLIGDFSSLPKEQLSEDMKLQLNADTQKVIKDCMAEVEQLLKKENELFERFAKELLEKEELDYDEIEAIFLEYGKENPRRFASSHSSDSAYKPPASGSSGEGKSGETPGK